MRDIERAKELLASDGSLTCAFVCGAEERTSRERGISPLADLIGRETLAGFSAADRVVGRAAAFCYCLLGVRAVYAEVLSSGGERVLKCHGIDVTYAKKTDMIRNRAGDGPCPMERAVEGIESPEEAFEAIRKKRSELKKAQP